MNKLLKFLGIWNIVFGSLFLITVIFFIPGVLLLVSGIIFLSYTKLPEEELCKKKTSLLIWSIIFIFFNIVSAIIGFVLFDKLNDFAKSKTLSINQNNQNSTIKEKIDPEIKKMDLMLKLGVGLVILSGFIIATSNWSMISNSLKVLLLFLLAILFYGLSYISEKKLKIKKSEIIYYTLSLLFLVFGTIGIGHFGVLGEYLSFNGDGSLLYTSIMFLIISLLLYITYRKYLKEFLMYLIYIFLTLFEIFVLLYLKIDFGTILLIDSATILLSLFAKIEDKNSIRLANYLNYFIYFIAFSTLIYSFYILISSTINTFIDSFVNSTSLITKFDFRIICIFMTYLITTIYMYLKSIKDKSKIMNIFTPIIFVINGVVVLSIILSMFNRLFFASYLIYGVLLINLIAIIISLFNKENKKLFVSTFIVSNLSLFINYSFAYSENSYLPILIALVLLIINIIVNINKSNLSHLKIEKYQQPFKIILLSLAIFMYLITKTQIFKWYDFMLITSAIIFVVYFFQKNQILKYIYYITSIILSVIYLILTLIDINVTFKLINILMLFLITFISFKNKDTKYNGIKYILYIISGFALYNFIDFGSTYYSLLIPCNIILVLTFLLLSYILRSNKKLLGINLSLVLLPCFSFINTYLSASYTYRSILVNIGLIALVLIITRIILLDIPNKVKNTLEIIFISFINLFIVFTFGLEHGLYMGIISLIGIIIGTKFQKIYSLFYLGIVFTILNIIIQFKGLWERIPFPVYLLIVGLILIGIVMYKELNKNKTNLSNIDLNKHIQNEQIIQNYNYKIVISIVVTLVLLTINSGYLSEKNDKINMIKEYLFKKTFINEIKTENKNIDFDQIKVSVESQNQSIQSASIAINKNYKLSLKNIARKIQNNNQHAIINVYRVNDIETLDYYYNDFKKYTYGLNINTELNLILDSEVEYVNISSYYKSLEIDFDEYNEANIKLKIYKNHLFDPANQSLVCEQTNFNEEEYKEPSFKYNKESKFLEAIFYVPSDCSITNNDNYDTENDYISKDIKVNQF